MVAFSAKTPAFEGPLEVLLHCIEQRKLSISDIALAQVADDFLAYVKRFERFPMAEGANFLLVASTLLLIKSKSLLPSLELSAEEKGDIGELERRLTRYQKVRKYATTLRARVRTQRMFLPEARERAPVFVVEAVPTLATLRAVLATLLHQLPRPEKLARAVIDTVLSLDEVIVRLTERITERLQFGFREFTGDTKNQRSAGWRKEIIVSFLALLELVRRGSVRATQERHFDDILIESDHIGVPTYQ